MLDAGCLDAVCLDDEYSNSNHPQKNKTLSSRRCTEYVNTEQEDMVKTPRTIIIIDVDSRPKVIQIDTINKSILHLITQISQSINIPLSDLRCVYRNKELSSHNSESIKDLGIQNGDIIHAKLRLKGGSLQNTEGIDNKDYSSLTQEEKDSFFQKTWKKLSLTKGYYLGDEIVDESRTKEPDRGQATGDDIDQALRKILHNEAHIIHPDTFCLTSIFSNDKENAKEAIYTLAKQIYDMKTVHIKNKEEICELNPRLMKPVIAVLNTQGKNDVTESKEMETFDNYYGSHWVSLVILPRNFVGLRHKFSANKNKQLVASTPNERIFLFDSLPHYPSREVPLELKKVLKHGMQTKQTIEGETRLDITPSAVETDCLVKNNTYKRQQHYQDETCGLWAIYNALMVVLDGTDNFWHEFFRKDTAEEETRFGAGQYLRSIIKELSLGQSDMLGNNEEINEPVNEATPLEILEDEEHLSNLEIDKGNKRKFSQISQQNLDFMIINPQKTPVRSPKRSLTKNSNSKKKNQNKQL